MPAIGRRFGGRDHTTVLHAIRRVGSLECSDEIVSDIMWYLRGELCGHADRFKSWPVDILGRAPGAPKVVGKIKLIPACGMSTMELAQFH